MPAPAIGLHSNVFYELATGALWSWRMVTDFRLLRMVLDREDIRPILDQRRAAGATGVRVLGAKSASDNPAFPSLFVLDPREPGIYDGIDQLFETLRVEGFCCEFVIIADEKSFGRPFEEQRAHCERVYEIARRHRHVVLELVNEWQQNMRGAEPAQFPQPTDLLWSRGSGVGDGEPATPPGTHTTYHNDRGPEWPRKFKSNLELFDKYHVPCLSNEPQRCDGDEWPVSDWFEAGSLCQLLGPGATFHGAEGRTSSLWSPAVLERAAAFFAGMNAVPLEAQQGVYAVAIPGGTGLDPHDSLRTYALVRGNEQWAVVLRPGPSYPMNGNLISPKTVNGWSIQEIRGPRGTVLRLSR